MSASVFPAYVGMSPHIVGPVNHVPCVPRIRGDEPAGQLVSGELVACSPHTWG